ncbi:MAG: cytochrome b5 domain-containing protein [Sphingobacteriales bacterium JAD_PAG50586_3]|nr:MAG: cytochrome b5 domain-containing protein [Sphingobacteriales bacterium JAD_PAG50586_3]
MKTNVTGAPVAEKSFLTASLLRVLAILLIVVLSIFSSCTNTVDKADTSTAQTAPQTTDFAYQYTEPETQENVPSELVVLPHSNSIALVDAVAKQEFAVKNKKDTTIVGSKGIKVLIPKNCFDLPNPNAEVKIELKEYTTAEDFVFANLTTSSNGRMLESGGTIYINATSEGKNVSLKKGQKLSLAFPTGKAKPKPGMQTFYGVKESDGNVNWETTEFAAITVNNSSLSNKNIVTWKSDWVDKIVLGQKISLLTGRNYQVQAYGSNNHCTRFADTTNYKNVLEYFKDKFKVSEHDLKQLKDSYIIYTYRYWNGNVYDVTTALEFHSKKDDSKQLKEAVKRVKTSIGKLIKGMPKGENTKYPGKEVIRFYFNNFTQFEPLNYTLDINDNKTQKTVTELLSYPDTMSLGEYTAYIDSIAKAKKPNTTR